MSLRSSRGLRSAIGPALIALAALLACLPMIGFGASNGHSLPLNLMWLREFSAQLAVGEWYPRWLPGMNEGAGSPTFFFYPPLPFYLASLGPIACPTCEPTVQLALGECLILALSGVSFYGFAKRKGTALAATVGAILYMLLPYHYEIDLWHRQAIAEFAAYIWIPLPFLFVDKLSKRENGMSGLAISYGLLIFTHLPSALLIAPFLAVHAGMLSLRNRSPILIAKFAAGIAVGVLISSLYLLPALLTQDYISPQFWWRPYFEYHRWFFLDGLDEPNAQFGNRLFFVFLLSTSIFALLWLAAFPCRKERKRLELYLPCAFVGLAWFAMSPASRFVWELIPILQKVQFPWRVGIAIDFAVATTAIYAIDCISSKGKQIPRILAATAIALFGYTVASGVLENYQSLDLYKPARFIEVRERRIQSGRDAPEYFPAWVERTPRVDLGPIAAMDPIGFDRANGEVRLVRAAPRRIAMDVNLSAETELTVRQFFYPGWKAVVAGRPPLAIEPSAPAGLIRLRAPPGRYRLSLELAPLREEKVGALLSALGLLLAVLPSLPGAVRSVKFRVGNPRGA